MRKKLKKPRKPRKPGKLKKRRTHEQNLLRKSWWISQCDQAWSKAIRSRDPNCQLAGKDSIRCGGNIQAMHIRGRGNWGIRYDLQNGVGGCAGHHVYYTYHDAEWNCLVEKLWPGRLATLTERQMIYGKGNPRSLQDYIALHTDLKKLTDNPIIYG